MWATGRIVLKIYSVLPSIYTSMLLFYFELCLHARDACTLPSFHMTPWVTGYVPKLIKKNSMREMFFCLTDKTPSALQSLFCLFMILKSLFTPPV